ncbi:putative sensor-like histidine kinase [compost metagenome]
MKSAYRTFFLKNLYHFILPMLIPIAILGTFSAIIIQQYIGKEATDANLNVLKGMQSNVDLQFEQLDTLYMHFVASAIELSELKSILSKPLPSLEDYKRLAAIKNFIDSPAIARSYIDSIYIYLENDKNRFITSTTGGLMEFSDFYDVSWYDEYLRRSALGDDYWTGKRSFLKYNLFNYNTEVISLYQTLYTSSPGDGVIVLNIKMEHLQEQLSALRTPDNQYLLMLDSANQIILQNRPFQEGDTEELQLLLKDSPNETLSSESPDSRFVYSILSSEKYGWRFVSITPKKSLYELPLRLGLYTLLAILFSFAVAAWISQYFAKQHMSEIRQITNLLQSAEKGEPLPVLPNRKHNIYNYIIQRILVHFLENNYLNAQLAERKAKAEMLELSALQAQLNPHFLLNTFDTINWKAASVTGNMNSELNQMIGHLGDILKTALDYEHKYIPLEEELEYTHTYIQIQKMRYQDKFEVLWDCGADAQQFMVLKLLLQPLIENSLYHGIRKVEGKRYIKIKARLQQERLLISVTDNGQGMDRDQLQALRSRLGESTGDLSSHIGVVNTHKRLQLAYGELSGLQVYSKWNSGTMVTITIPLKETL